MKANFWKLMSAKWLISISLTGTFIYLCVQGLVKPELFIPIYTMVVGTYFGQSVANKPKD